MSRLVTRRATLRPASLDRAARTVRAVLATSNPILHPGEGPQYYGGPSAHYQALHLSGIRIGDGAALPLLVDHQNELGSLAGRVDGFAIEASGKRLSGVLTIDEGALGDALLDKIEAGSLRAVSIAYELEEWRDTGKELRGAPVYEVTRAHLREVSFVAVGRDPGAILNATEFDMPNTTVETGATSAASVKNFYAAGRNLGLDIATVESLLDAGTSPSDVQALITRKSELDARNQATARLEPRGTGSASSADDMISGLAARLLGKPGNAWSGRRLLDMARQCVANAGVTASTLSDGEIIEAAYSPKVRNSGLHSTSDFAAITGVAAQKALLARFETAPSPLKMLAARSDASDFKTKHAIQFGQGPELKEVAENGEITSGTIAESSETYRVRTFARIFGLSRVALVNDDVSAFAQTIRAMSDAAVALEGDVLHSLLSANAYAGVTMSDGVAVFDSAHANVAASGAGLDATTVGAAVAALRKQKGVGGNFYVSVAPRYLLCGPDAEMAARQVVAAVSANSVENANPWQGAFEVLVEPRLEATNSWYLFADPSSAPVLEFAYLSAAPGPQITTREGFEVLGQEFRLVLDFGAGVVDHRGAFRNAGE